MNFNNVPQIQNFAVTSNYRVLKTSAKKYI